MRNCGECDLCCKLLPIEILDKQPNVSCKFCNKGCTIHNDRFEVCRNFQCEWTLDEEMDEELRPDKTHIIFEKINEEVYLGLADPKYLNIVNTDIVKDYIKELNDNGISVIMSSYSNAPKLYFLAKGVSKEFLIEIVNDTIKKMNK